MTPHTVETIEPQRFIKRNAYRNACVTQGGRNAKSLPLRMRYMRYGVGIGSLREGTEKESDMIDAMAEYLGLRSCPQCGALHKPGEHSPECCAVCQKANALKRSLIEAELWESNDEVAIKEHFRKFNH